MSSFLSSLTLGSALLGLALVVIVLLYLARPFAMPEDEEVRVNREEIDGLLLRKADLLRNIRELVPVKTGLLKRRGFRVANSRIHNGRRSSAMIGVYLGLRKGKGDPFYGRFQNDGWQAGQTKVPGKAFVQRAFGERKAAAVDLIVRSAEAGAEVVKRKVGLK